MLLIQTSPPLVRTHTSNPAFPDGGSDLNNSQGRSKQSRRHGSQMRPSQTGQRGTGVTIRYGKTTRTNGTIPLGTPTAGPGRHRGCRVTLRNLAVQRPRSRTGQSESSGLPSPGTFKNVKAHRGPRPPYRPTMRSPAPSATPTRARCRGSLHHPAHARPLST